MAEGKVPLNQVDAYNPLSVLADPMPSVGGMMSSSSTSAAHAGWNPAPFPGQPAPISMGGDQQTLEYVNHLRVLSGQHLDHTSAIRQQQTNGDLLLDQLSQHVDTHQLVLPPHLPLLVLSYHLF